MLRLFYFFSPSQVWNTKRTNCQNHRQQHKVIVLCVHRWWHHLWLSQFARVTAPGSLEGVKPWRTSPRSCLSPSCMFVTQILQLWLVRVADRAKKIKKIMLILQSPWRFTVVPLSFTLPSTWNFSFIFPTELARCISTSCLSVMDSALLHLPVNLLTPACSAMLERAMTPCERSLADSSISMRAWGPTFPLA